MVDLTHIFGSEAKQALDNAREYAHMSVSQKLDEIDALARLGEEMVRTGKNQQQRREVGERMEHEEMEILVKIGRIGHV